MIFMEECFVSVPSSDDYFTFNPYYVRNSQTMYNLQNDVSKLFPTLQYIPFEKALSIKWNTLFLSSYMQEEHIPSILNINCNEIILVEDGLFDYTTPDNTYPFYGGKPLYLFHPEIASSEATRSNINALIPNKEIIKKFRSIYEKQLCELEKLQKDIPILFTTPLAEDFFAPESLSNDILSHIANNYSAKQLILKKHPRDHFLYNSSEIEIIECPQNIPGQFLDEMFIGEKIFLFPSTVSFMCGELSNIIFLNPLPQDSTYCTAFNNVISSGAFSQKKNIQLDSLDYQT